MRITLPLFINAILFIVLYYNVYMWVAATYIILIAVYTCLLSSIKMEDTVPTFLKKGTYKNSKMVKDAHFSRGISILISSALFLYFGELWVGIFVSVIHVLNYHKLSELSDLLIDELS